MSQRPTTLKRGTTLYWTIATYDNSGVLIDADSNPTIALRKNGAAHTGTTTVTKRAGSTGLYDCSFNPVGENNADQFQIEETATISFQSYVNIWNFDVTEELPEGLSSVSVDTNTGSIGADLVAINQEAITATSGNSNLMADRFVDFLDHSSANSRNSGNFNTTIPDNAGISANGSAIAGLNDFNPASDNVANVLNVASTAVCVSNSDMRGTDGANTIAPDNAGINSNGTAIANVDTVVDLIKVDTTGIVATTDKLDTALVLDGSVYQYTVNALENAPSGGGGGGSATLAKQNEIIADIAALNDFDPATDSVGNVVNVATTAICVSNSDMRGTDNANTIAPDNAGISSNGTALATTTKTGVQYTATAQSGDTIQVTLS